MTPDPFDQVRPPPEEAAAEPERPEAAGAALPLNDYGNGKRFVSYHGRDLLHVPRVGWFTWDGRRWRHDRDEIDVRRLAQDVQAKVLAELPHVRLDAATAEATKDDPKAQEAALQRARAEHRRHARATGNKPRIDALIGESVTDLAVPLDALDSGALDLNLESGTLRFTITEAGEGAGRVVDYALHPHRREDRLSKLMPVAWDEQARAPVFDAFLERVQPDPAVRGFVQRWLGLSLTGIKHQQLCFWYGGGANGKSVLIDLIARIAGDYGATAKIESLTGRNRRSGGDATPDLVPLIGARLVRASEPEEGERLQEGRIKELTGGEPILVRALNEDFVEVVPIFKLTISGNHKPEIRGGDDGIWRRLLLVPWDVTIPEAERDPLLGEKLWAEREGVLLWLVDGLIDALEGGLRPPDRVLAATDEYRREQDPVGQFLTDCAVFTGVPSDVVRSAELVKMFNYWLIEAGSSAWKAGTVQRALAKKAGLWHHPKGGLTMTASKASVSQYVGIRMVEAFERRFRDAPKDHQGNPIGVRADDG